MFADSRAPGNSICGGAPHVGFTCGDFDLGVPISLLPNRIDGDQCGFSLLIERPTAPRPIFGMLHQLSCNWIRMHIVKLLAKFLSAPNIEVIESGLPESWQISDTFCKREAQLPCRRTASLSPQIPRNPLLQHLQDNRWRGFLRLADEQMHVIRHNHVSDQQEFVTFTNLAKGLDEEVSRPQGVEQWQPPIARAQPAKSKRNWLTPYGGPEYMISTLSLPGRKVRREGCHVVPAGLAFRDSA